jgi:NADH-quinone oxidoreductase subunit A
MLVQYANVFVFLLVAFAFIFVNNTLSRLVHTKIYTAEKFIPYECGEDPVANARIKFNTRFYVVALVFLIFDVEIAFLFPWAVVFRRLGTIALVEMFIFIAILLIGLAYVWAKKDLEWIRTFRSPGVAHSDVRAEGSEPAKPAA